MSKKSQNPRTFTIVKPAAYAALDPAAVHDYLEAHQRVLTRLERMVKLGETQIKEATGYSNESLPPDSPDFKKFTLDGVVFEVTTIVRPRTEYQTVLDQIGGFLEVMVNDWRSHIRKDCVRTYNGEAFVRWDYFMGNVFGYSSRRTTLEIAQTLQAPDAPVLEQLIIPVDIYRAFDIKKPGAAKLWSEIKSFCENVRAANIVPLEARMEERTGVTRMPDETLEYFEQVGEYLLGVRTIPSPQRQPGKVFSFLFEIPGQSKPRGSTGLPVITNSTNYLERLEPFMGRTDAPLERFKSLHQHIGELIVFYHGLEENPKVLEAFPFLPEYKMKREGELNPKADNMFISVQAFYDHLHSLQADYTTSRTLRVHRVWPIAN